MSLHFHPLKVRAVTPDTDDAVILSFEVPASLQADFQFVPGQYLTLRHEVKGQDLRRSYSICAGADDGELRVGVRRVEGGAFSTWVHGELKAGALLVPEGARRPPVYPAFEAELGVGRPLQADEVHPLPGVLQERRTQPLAIRLLGVERGPIVNPLAVPVREEGFAIAANSRVPVDAFAVCGADVNRAHVHGSLSEEGVGTPIEHGGLRDDGGGDVDELQHRGVLHEQDGADGQE